MVFDVLFPRNHYNAALSASLAMFLCGSSFTWITPILPKLQGSDAIVKMTSTEISWIVSIPPIGLLISQLVSRNVVDIWGRKAAIILAGPFVMFTWLLVLFFKSVYGFLLSRLIQGFSFGILVTGCPIYLGEIAPAKIRGRITALATTMYFAGSVFQYVTESYLTYDMNIYINLILTVLIFVFFTIQPESPYFLMLRDSEERTRRTLKLLRYKMSDEDLNMEIELIKECVESERHNTASWFEIISTSADRRVLFITQVIFAVYGLSGSLSLISYLGILLKEANWHVLRPETLMIISGVVTLIMSVISTSSVDLFERRFLLIISAIGCTISHLTIGMFFYLHDKSSGCLSTVRWIPAAAIFSYVIFLSIGLDKLPYVLQIELFPTHTRAYGRVLSNVNECIMVFISLHTFQVVTDLIGLYANFIIYGCFCAFAGVFTYYCVPETKGKTFLEIRKHFARNSISK